MFTDTTFLEHKLLHLPLNIHSTHMYLDLFCEYLHGYEQRAIWGGRILSLIICDHFTFFKSVNITLFLGFKQNQTVILKMCIKT